VGGSEKSQFNAADAQSESHGCHTRPESLLPLVTFVVDDVLKQIKTLSSLLNSAMMSGVIFATSGDTILDRY